jgi:hypothetical protein
MKWNRVFVALFSLVVLFGLFAGISREAAYLYSQGSLPEANAASLGLIL